MLEPSSIAVYISYTCSKCGCEHVERRLSELHGVKQVQCSVCSNIDRIKPIKSVNVEYSGNIDTKVQTQVKPVSYPNDEHCIHAARSLTKLGYTIREIKAVATELSHSLGNKKLTLDEFIERTLLKLITPNAGIKTNDTIQNPHALV